MPLDPQVKIILEEDAAKVLPTLVEHSPIKARKQMAELAPPVDPLLMVDRVEDRRIKCPGGDIPMRLYYPENDEIAGHPYVSPLRAENLGKLPDALVLTAQYDPLCDEGQAYARRLQEAGVNVKLTHYDGMIHGFFKMTSRVDKARQALDEVAAALKRM
jgi:acetyl esterase/lipase